MMPINPKKVKVSWRNLLKERCPKCECVLHWNEDRQVYICALNDGLKGFFSCDFSCTKRTIAYVKKHGIKDIEMEDFDPDEENQGSAGGSVVCRR